MAKQDHPCAVNGGRQALLMASDAPPDRFDQPKGFSVTVGVDTAAEAERIFNAFAEGGTVRMPMGETFFAERFGMVADRFGTPWMVLTRQAKPRSVEGRFIQIVAPGPGTSRG
jgi:PhnB protein